MDRICSRVLAPILLFALAACSTGQTTPARDLRPWADGSDASPWPDITVPDRGPDGYIWPDANKQDSSKKDAFIPPDGALDTLGPDALSPDVLAPDVLAPDVLAPDVLAPDTGPTGTLTAPFVVDFEANDGGLVGTKDWEWGLIDFVQGGTDCSTSMAGPPSGHSGTRAWGTKLNSCYSGLGNADSSCSNASTTDDSVLTATVKIPAGWSKATLSYWEWYDVFLDFDWSETRVNGAVIDQTCSGSHSTPTAWAQRTVDLTPYVGQTIQLSFHFMATTVVNYAGWYIDDLSVTQ